MVWEEPRRVVAGCSRGRNAHIVLVAIAQPIELPATRHGVALRLPAIRPIGVELDADGLGVKAAEVDLDADLMPGSLRRRADRPEARVRPVLGELAPPAHELRS